MKTMKSQAGFSLLGWLIILTMAGVLAITAIKLTPTYLEYYNVSQILEQMQADKSLKGAQKQQIAAAFNKRLNISQVYGIQRGDYSITKAKGKRSFILKLDYEVRKPLFANLSIIASFKRQAEVGG